MIVQTSFRSLGLAADTHPLSSGPSRTNPSERTPSCCGPGRGRGCAAALGFPERTTTDTNTMKNIQRPVSLSSERRGQVSGRCRLLPGVAGPTWVMEPPGLLEEMSGGGSVSGRTAAILPPSCCSPDRAGWPACWNAARHQTTPSLYLHPLLKLKLPSFLITKFQGLSSA